MDFPFPTKISTRFGRLAGLFRVLSVRLEAHLDKMSTQIIQRNADRKKAKLKVGPGFGDWSLELGARDH